MDQGVNKLQPGAKSGLLPLFINKVLSELSHALSLMYFPRLLSVCSGRAEQLPRRPHGPHSQKCVGPGQPRLWIDLAVTSATCGLSGLLLLFWLRRWVPLGLPVTGLLVETVCSENAFSAEPLFRRQHLRRLSRYDLRTAVQV